MIAILLLAAQLHTATAVEKLHGQVVFTSEVPAAPRDFDTAAAKVFEVTARQFEFEFSPDPIIDQGDSVTLNIQSVDVQHGFFLELYMTQGVILNPGQTVTVQFIAGTPGSFTYFCIVPSCGSGHVDMHGRLTVNAVTAAPPSITGFTPQSAPVTGGTPVAIAGRDFQNDAVVRFGSVNAVVTVVHSAESITAFTPAHPAGAVSITLINADGQSTVAGGLFTFVAPPKPPARRRAVSH